MIGIWRREEKLEVGFRWVLGLGNGGLIGGWFEGFGAWRRRRRGGMWWGDEGKRLGDVVRAGEEYRGVGGGIGGGGGGS